MNNFMTDIMELESAQAVDNYVTKHSFDLPGGQKVKLQQFAWNRKLHILRLRKEKKDSFKLQLN